MTVAVILVLSWQPGWRPSGHHEVGLGLSANKKLAMRPNGFRIARQPLAIHILVLPTLLEGASEALRRFHLSLPTLAYTSSK